jgi:hypothetical protein
LKISTREACQDYKIGSAHAIGRHQLKLDNRPKGPLVMLKLSDAVTWLLYASYRRLYTEFIWAKDYLDLCGSGAIGCTADCLIDALGYIVC